METLSILFDKRELELVVIDNSLDLVRISEVTKSSASVCRQMTTKQVVREFKTRSLKERVAAFERLQVSRKLRVVLLVGTNKLAFKVVIPVGGEEPDLKLRDEGLHRQGLQPILVGEEPSGDGVILEGSADGRYLLIVRDLLRLEEVAAADLEREEYVGRDSARRELRTMLSPMRDYRSERG